MHSLFTVMIIYLQKPPSASSSAELSVEQLGDKMEQVSAASANCLVKQLSPQYVQPSAAK